MRRDEVVRALHAKPFRPFRICVSDGSAFDIRHPEMLMVTRSAAIIGLQANGSAEVPPDSYPAIERHTIVDLLPITRIEQLDRSGQAAS